MDKSTLCKPLIPREHLFYLNVPEELVKFVPLYKGVIQIHDTGRGYPPLVYQPIRSPKSPFGKCLPGTALLSSTLPAKYGAEFNIYENDRRFPGSKNTYSTVKEKTRTNSEGEESIKVDISTDEDSAHSLNNFSSFSPYELK